MLIKVVSHRSGKGKDVHIVANFHCKINHLWPGNQEEIYS